MTTLLLLLNGSLMAGIYALAKAGTASALGVLAWQLLFATTALTAVASWRGERAALTRANLRYAAIAGMLGMTGPSLVTFCALARVPAGFIGVIGALAPMFTYALALALRIEALRTLRAAGIVLGLAGVLGLLLPAGSLPGDGSWPWALAAVASPLLLAAGNLFRSLAWPVGLAPLGAASLMLAVQALVVVPLAIALGHFQWPLPVGAPADVMLLGGGLLTTIFYLGAFELQRRGGPVIVAQLGYVITAASLLLGAAVFGERYPVTAWLAIAAVLGGLSLVNRAQPSPSTPHALQPSDRRS
ncbi:DMT family transporter [Piscinibacter gummiphilus]|uniref:DMT family transporter n=1 Tax=Piscinibacter gummiphilus TaxID=946333 RepID=A0ABZ0CM92_9BURK|nr:DMT family transporter [Piscinibacter gummiphilus]WOB06112.1 DMT family transporter [Piscinibacter gummiphilus]